MTIRISKEAIYILKTLTEAGFEAYIVGGAVRDLILGSNAVTDYDFATNATPEQTTTLFPESFYENEFGTVMITPTKVRAQMGLVSETTSGDSSVEEIPTELKLSTSNRLIDIANATNIHPSLQESAKQAEEVMEVVEGQEENKSIAERNFEITTFRSDGAYRDHRRPESVVWGKTLEEDLERRDFTINAMAISLASFETLLATAPRHGLVAVSPDYYQLIDPFNGRHDLEEKQIVTVGDAHQRFEEDALRMLRAVRFAVQLDFTIAQPVIDAISARPEQLEHVSWERIRDEFLKMLASRFPKRAIEQLDSLGLLEYILPELLAAKGVNQGGHHTTDVWTHSLDALAECPSPDVIVRLATLLHDIAKPNTFRVIDGQPTFYNHEIVGSRIAKKIAQRLRLSKKEQDRIFILVRYHMFHYQPHNTDASIRRFMRKVGLENIDDILDLRESDRLGSGARKTSWRLEEMKERMIEQLHQPMAVTDLAIDGNDLVHELNLQPGPIFRIILDALLEKVLENPQLNTKQALLDEARQLIEEAKQEA